MVNRLSAILKPIKHRISFYYKKIISLIDSRPLSSFIFLLSVTLALIIVSNLLRKPKITAENNAQPVKTVDLYHIGSTPKANFQAQIEKSGVVTITSLIGGVVQQINAYEGSRVSKGQTLIWLSSNYQGGNTFSLQRQIAEKQYDNADDTFDSQKDLIGKQRDLANKNRDNTEELRKISDQSKSDTQAIIDLNNSQLEPVNAQLDSLQQITNPTDDQKKLIASLAQSKTQLLSANLQLNTSLRNLDYQNNTDNPPTKLADLQKDIALKQLDIQEKSLTLNREISRLQLQLSRVNEALMYPAAPIDGVVQRVFLKVGQAVSPGTPLMIISGPSDQDPINAIVYVPREIAQNISRIDNSTLHIAGGTYESLPFFVSQDAVQGGLYAIYYSVPENYNHVVTDKSYIEIEIPVGYADTNAAIPFIPIDSVYQTETSSYVFLAKKNKAEARQVKLGNVFGRFVEVQSGLSSGDQLILDRNIIAGDSITPAK